MTALDPVEIAQADAILDHAPITDEDMRFMESVEESAIYIYFPDIRKADEQVIRQLQHSKNYYHSHRETVLEKLNTPEIREKHRIAAREWKRRHKKSALAISEQRQ
jgi:hypothetical protein